MKMLLSTTALALALGMPAATLAQTTPPPERATQSQNTNGSGFLAERGQSDLFASELMGHDVHARRMPADRSAVETQSAMNEGQDMATIERAELDAMDNIGRINEIVLSHDGQVRAIVIGVGGFLGIGARDVAVTMDQVTFASDLEDRSQMYVIVNTAADMLEESPAYDRTAMSEGRPADRTDVQESERTSFIRPDVARDGYDRVEVSTAA